VVTPGRRPRDPHPQVAVTEIASEATSPNPARAYAFGVPVPPARRFWSDRLVPYLARMDTATTILWCYFLWYAVIVARHFDASPRLWLTSVGLAIIVGFALLLNAGWGTLGRVTVGPWQRFRFFAMPFCVSSFSALVKGKGFVLVFSPAGGEVAAGVATCAAFVLARGLARHARR
jgi:hypothetical protein